jgi:hypothetical protein
VTSSELARVAQSGNLLAALRQLHPSFLIGRDGTLVVSVNGSVFGDVSVLRDIPVTDVCKVRLLRGTSGAGRPVILPTGRVSIGNGLIEVSLRPCTR